MTIRERFQEYVLGNNPTRKKADRWTLLLAVVLSSISVLKGTAGGNAAKQGLLIVAIGMIGTTITHSLFPSRQARGEEGTDPVPTQGSSMRRPFLTATFAAIVVFLGLSEEHLEAEILERRLRSLTKTVPLKKESILQISDLFGRAETAKVRLSPPALGRVKTALKQTYEVDRSLEKNAIQAGAAIVSYSTLSLPPEIEHALMHGKPLVPAPHDWGFAPIGNGGEMDTTIRRETLSSKRYQLIDFNPAPDYALMEKIGQNAAGSAEYGPAFMLAQELDAELDGFHLRRVIFRNARIFYNGGPVILEHVYFLNCEFTLAIGPNSWALVDAFSPEHPVDFKAT